MKPQDIILPLLLLFLLWRNRKNWTLIAGILLLVVSIPLFAKHIFFTAERFAWYAAVFFLVAVGQSLFRLKSK